jgi:hypothetical protein
VLPLVLVARFVVELCLVVGVAVVAASASDAWPVRVLVAAAAVVALAVVWGLVLSPKARIGLPVQVRVVLELVLFGLTAIGLWGIGYVAAGALLFAADVVILGGLFLLGERPGSEITSR